MIKNMPRPDLMKKSMETSYKGKRPYHCAPPNWREVEEKEFAQHVSQGFGEHEHRQIHHINEDTEVEKSFLNADLFFNRDGTGVAIVTDYYGIDPLTGVGYYEAERRSRVHKMPIPEMKYIRFYRFGCAHNYKKENVGRCLHKLTCSICGYEETVDSSD